MEKDSNSIGKPRRIAGRVLVILPGVMLLGSGAAKLAHVPKVVSELGAMGFDGSKLTFVAILEIFSALLFLVPVTRAAGLVLVSSFLGGAIATHLQHNQLIVQPSIVLTLVWLGISLRHPEVLWSFRPASKEREQRAAQALRAGEIKA